MEFSPGALHGAVSVPGDKSISHRALIAALKSPQPLRIQNLNPGRDVFATQCALEALGARIERSESDALVHPPLALHEPQSGIDCMNSGSTARMLLGVCAGANVRAEFSGDASLRRRPMEPVAAQLRAFGARIDTSDGRLPLTVHGRGEVQTRDFILLEPSAQVKSALLFAGWFSGEPVTITGDRGSRDHTERLLLHLGADLRCDRGRAALQAMPTTFSDLSVCGDFSAAAFFIVAATVTPGSSILVKDVGVNPTRTGLLDALRDMGARIEIASERERCGERLADLRVQHAPLRATAIGGEVALRAIDEIPVLAVAAAFAQGQTRITGVADLRNKESDRIAAIERLLSCAGIRVEPLPTGLLIDGGAPSLHGELLETHGDHRTAMAAAALAAGAGSVRIDDESAIDVSFPSFAQQLRAAQNR